MSTETNKAVVRRGFEEGLNEGKVAVFDELWAPDYIHHDPDRPTIRTREDFKRYVTMTRNTYPDIHFTIEDMIAEGEQVAVRWTWRGTNTGDLVIPRHIPATGKQVMATGITIFRFAEGKCVEDWHLTDFLGIYQQLGLIPMPEPVG
jgi:steroid delta-isomerase-like uncharacterized protein